MPTLTLRMTTADLREVRRRARREGKTLSAFARGSMLPAAPAKEGARARLSRDRATGSLVLRSPAGTPALTPDMVREALADLP